MKIQQGMSTIDTCVILGVAGLALVAWYFPEYKWWGIGFTVCAVIGFIIWSSLSEGAARDAQMRERYLKGEITKKGYILEVGEKYFRKHHPDEDLD